MKKTEKFYSIAIDGPAGSGKSSVAKLIANELNWIYISTGNMFRAYAWYMKQLKIEFNQLELINRNLNNIEVILSGNDVFVVDSLTNKKIEISNEIKDPSISYYASQIATYPSVRNKLLIDQRKIAENNNVVMDGRDIGSVVLPFATLKIYLDASIEARVQRRINELKLLNRDLKINFNDLYKEIEARDYNDMNRKIAPLIKTKDSIVINNDKLDLEQTKHLIIKHFKNKK